MRHGDKATTLAELYERHAPSLYAYARLLCRSPGEAEDVVQNCFVRLAGQLDRLAEVENQRGYLLAVCRNEAFSYRSRWRRWWQSDLACGTVRLDGSPTGGEVDRDEAARIQQALAALPPPQREVVYLKVWEDLTFAEIAALLNITLSTASSRYQYGIEKLKGLLGHD